MRAFLSFLLIINISVSCYCQYQSKTEIENAINSVSSLIDRYYVFPEKGRDIAKHLGDEYRRGRFGQVKTWFDFDTAVTRCLQGFSHDGHLYVRYNPATAKELLKSENEPTKILTPDNYDPFYYGREALENNFGFREVKILDGNIGYIKLSQINISFRSLPVLYSAMRLVENTETLIIDLSNNGGGGSEIGAVFESYFLPENTPLLEFKSRNGIDKLEKTVVWLTEKKYEKPLYIIINKGTASAAEAFTYVLQHHKRALVAGQPSAGAAHMNSWYAINNQIYLSVSTAAPTLPGTERSWEQEGIKPDHVVEDGKALQWILKEVKRK